MDCGSEHFQVIDLGEWSIVFDLYMLLFHKQFDCGSIHGAAF